MTFNVYNGHFSSEFLHQNEGSGLTLIFNKRSCDFFTSKSLLSKASKRQQSSVVTGSTVRVFTAFARVLLIRYEISQKERESEI